MLCLNCNTFIIEDNFNLVIINKSIVCPYCSGLIKENNNLDSTFLYLETKKNNNLEKKGIYFDTKEKNLEKQIFTNYFTNLAVNYGKIKKIRKENAEIDEDTKIMHMKIEKEYLDMREIWCKRK